MWRNLFALSIIIIFWTLFRALADISCAPTQPLQQQNRTHMKHRTPASTDPGVAFTTIENMIAASPAAGVTVAGFRRADRPIDQRELQVVTLKGDLWQINIELNDCDFHLEISGVGKTANEDRIIVEIPQGPAFVRARNALLQHLQAAGITLRPERISQGPFGSKSSDTSSMMPGTLAVTILNADTGTDRHKWDRFGRFIPFGQSSFPKA